MSVDFKLPPKIGVVMVPGVIPERDTGEPTSVNEPLTLR